MNELDFYTSLIRYLHRNNAVTEELFEEVNTRLTKLHNKEKITKWNNLCELIETAIRQYERNHKEYVDVTIDCDDIEIIVTNHNYIEVED